MYVEMMRVEDRTEMRISEHARRLPRLEYFTHLQLAEDVVCSLRALRFIRAIRDSVLDRLAILIV